MFTMDFEVTTTATPQIVPLPGLGHESLVKQVKITGTGGVGNPPSANLLAEILTPDQSSIQWGYHQQVAGQLLDNGAPWLLDGDAAAQGFLRLTANDAAVGTYHVQIKLFRFK
jgi:hypothetical protein